MKESHSLFVLFLLLITLLAVVSLSVKGWNYYLTPVASRPYLPEYDTMKPSGAYSHGLGIIGSLMIIVGVATYSTRKRMRSLWKLGKLSSWLEFHIFLCLIGPVIVIYHTTFKAGGIAAISMWTMISVAASGIIGRFLYTLIPRNLNGNELTLEEVDKRLHDLGASLESNPVGHKIIGILDDAFAVIQRPKSLSELISKLIQLQGIKSSVRKKIKDIVSHSDVSHETASEISSIANARASLLQKSLMLQQVERVFYYWHAIHLPFSVIMFLTLAAHVVVAVMLGYRWIL